MGWKTILFSNPCKLYVKNYQLQYESSEGIITIPLEDISTIILDHQQITLSNYLLMSCEKYNITLFTCNEKHQPNNILTPFYQHSRNTKIVFAHINIQEPLKKRLWQKIVKQKIYNQSTVLKKLFQNNELDNYINKVQSGDITNIEGQASKKYWSILFKNFKRHSEDKQNTLLDYGYAIIRGTLSKYIAASGMIPCLGIHHCNNLNSFNLTEDLIESFRPFVDLLVSQSTTLNDNAFTKIDKGYLLSILNKQCLFKGEQITIQNACEDVCQTLAKSMIEKDVTKLELPRFIED